MMLSNFQAHQAPILTDSYKQQSFCPTDNAEPMSAALSDYPCGVFSPVSPQSPISPVTPATPPYQAFPHTTPSLTYTPRQVTPSFNPQTFLFPRPETPKQVRTDPAGTVIPVGTKIP